MERNLGEGQFSLKRDKDLNTQGVGRGMEKAPRLLAKPLRFCSYFIHIINVMHLIFTLEF